MKGFSQCLPMTLIPASQSTYKATLGVVEGLSDAFADLGIGLQLAAGIPERSVESLVLTRDQERWLVAEAKELGDGLRLVVTQHGLYNNWFSHWHAYANTALVSVKGWSGYSRFSVAAFIAYEVILHGLRCLAEDYRPDELLHQETRGCLFDLCVEKQDINAKLQLGGLCPSCGEAVQSLGIRRSRLKAALAVLPRLGEAA